MNRYGPDKSRWLGYLRNTSHLTSSASSDNRSPLAQTHTRGQASTDGHWGADGGHITERNECMSKIPELVPSPHSCMGKQTSPAYLRCASRLLAWLAACQQAPRCPPPRGWRVARGANFQAESSKTLGNQGMGQTRTPLLFNVY